MDSLESLSKKLDETHEWPCLFTFKCVVPAASSDTFRQLFPEHSPRERESRSGKYISMTIEWKASSSREVTDIYRKASEIPGAILL